LEWYEEEVAALEATWRVHAPLRDGIVFYGSSSIRLWITLEEDFPGLGVVNAGFGGSTLAACAHFCPRLVLPHRPRGVIVYAGDNDLGDGRSPEDVLASWSGLMEHLEGVRVAFLSVKPSPARWSLMEQIEQANALIRLEVERRPQGFYIDIVGAMLDEDGRPRKELYAEDGLHLSPAGYRLWRDVVGRYLERFS
jgi:lysophospholipase L1-like esterase